MTQALNALKAAIPVFVALYAIAAIQKKSLKIWE